MTAEFVGRGWPVALLALCFAVLCSACLEPSAGGGSEPRRRAPGFDLPLLDGRQVRLEEHLGKVVLLDFWATWCGPCEVQMPVLDKLWEEAGGGDLMIVGVSVDTRPSAEVAAWVAERGFEYPIALGSSELAMDYNVRGFPAMVVIDPKGGIYTQHMGVWSQSKLEEAIEAARRVPPETAPLESAPGAASGIAEG